MRFHFAGIWKFNIAVVERRLQCDVIKWVISAVYIANGTLLKYYSLLVCAALQVGNSNHKVHLYSSPVVFLFKVGATIITQRQSDYLLSQFLFLVWRQRVITLVTIR